MKPEYPSLPHTRHFNTKPSFNTSLQPKSVTSTQIRYINTNSSRMESGRCGSDVSKWRICVALTDLCCVDGFVLSWRICVEVIDLRWSDVLKWCVEVTILCWIDRLVLKWRAEAKCLVEVMCRSDGFVLKWRISGNWNGQVLVCNWHVEVTCWSDEFVEVKGTLKETPESFPTAWELKNYCSPG